MNIVIPTIKTLLKYIWLEGERSTTVLCDSFVEEDHEWYSDHNTVRSNMPFKEFDDAELECFLVGDSHYRLIEFESTGRYTTEEKNVIEVYAIPVLEFKGRIFKLEQAEYDMKDSEVWE